MNYRCSANDFFTFNKWFSYFTNDFYIQQMTFTFNKKLIYSAIWKLCSVTWNLYSRIWDLHLTKWNFSTKIIYIHQTKFEWIKIYIQKHSAERKILSVSCTCNLKVFSSTFKRSLHITKMIFKTEVLGFFLLSYWSMNVDVCMWMFTSTLYPQGTILGTLFFLIYINHLSDGLTSNPKLFADDTCLFSVTHNINSTVNDFKSDLTKISNWFSNWKWGSILTLMNKLRVDFQYKNY